MMTFLGVTDYASDYGLAKLFVYQEKKQKKAVYHFAIVFGDIRGKEHVFCRVHSACITAEAFHAVNCDCRGQLDQAFTLAKKMDGVIIYLQQEGRGNGIEAKLLQMQLEQQYKIDTISAFQKGGFPADNRTYESAAFMLKNLAVQSVILHTADRNKIKQLQDLGIPVSARMHPKVNLKNAIAKRNLKAKQKKLHYFSK